VARLRGYLQPPGAGLAKELGRAGTVVLGPRGEDLTSATRSAFRAALPSCRGNEAVAARQALGVALAGQRREESR
jgi:hypothetical protein